MSWPKVEKAKLLARVAELEAEVGMLRGVGCDEADGTRQNVETGDDEPEVRGPCGACLKCARRERDEARTLLVEEQQARHAAGTKLALLETLASSIRALPFTPDRTVGEAYQDDMRERAAKLVEEALGVRRVAPDDDPRSRYCPRCGAPPYVSCGLEHTCPEREPPCPVHG